MSSASKRPREELEEDGGDEGVRQADVKRCRTVEDVENWVEDDDVEAEEEVITHHEQVELDIFEHVQEQDEEINNVEEEEDGEEELYKKWMYLLFGPEFCHPNDDLLL
eukprot:GILI01054325.1.p1 GENE.GILI01054325.1~~GILI01054325.1.p1  ORF type:complete len:108 (-),score=20.03 GILI01054325.1:62-385(-)